MKDSNIENEENLVEKRLEGMGRFIRPILLLPLIIIIVIVPLIMKTRPYNPNFNQFSWYSELNVKIDMFLFYKQWTLVTITSIMLTILLSRYYLLKGSFKKSILIIPLFSYAILSLLSAVFSEYKIYSFFGSMDQFEGIFALISYIIVTFYAMQIIDEEKDIKILISTISVAAIIMSVLGVMQYIGKDFFGTELGHKLITTRQYWGNLDSITLTMENNRVYMTLFNPNYVGMYVALLLPIFLVLLLFNKNIIKSIICILICLGLVISLFGSKSLAGYIGLAAALVLIVIFLRKEFIRNFHITIPILILVIVSLLYINKSTEYYLVNKFKSFIELEKTENNITDITTFDDKVSITYKGNEFNIERYYDEGYYYKVYDQNQDIIKALPDGEMGEYIVSDDRFPGFTYNYYVFEDRLGFYVKVDGKQWVFTNETDDGTYYYLNQVNKLDKIITAPSAIFTGYERIASTRGYLWSRTIPLLKDYMLLGSGPDTYVIAFPQQDYMNLQYYFPGMLVTKPHNMYLQIGVQTGVLSLIAFLIAYLMYAIDSIRLYIRGRFNNYYSKVGVGIFIGTAAYMVTALTNDSSITVAPVYWALLGIGIAVNKLAKPIVIAENKEIKEKKLQRKLEKKLKKSEN